MTKLNGDLTLENDSSGMQVTGDATELKLIGPVMQESATKPEIAVVGEMPENIISHHPNCEKLEIPPNVIELHKNQVEAAGLQINIRFVTLLTSAFKILVDGSRSDLASKAASLGTIILTMIQPISLNQEVYREYVSYTFSGIIASGGLLLSLAFHPVYFLSDPLLKLQQLVNIMLAIEKVLSKKIKENFSKELQNAIDRNTTVLKKTSIDPTLAGGRQSWNDLLAKLAAFEIFAISIQKGITIVNRDVKLESSLIPGVCFQSVKISEWIKPILKKEGWSLRVFARALNPFIFYFSFKNKVAGYLTDRLEAHFPESEDKNHDSFCRALMSEVHSNNPFIDPPVRAVLEIHQNRLNKKKK